MNPDMGADMPSPSMGAALPTGAPSAIGRLAKRLGLAGWLGLGLLVGAAWAHFSYLPVQQASVAQLESDVRQARHRMLDAAQVGASSAQPALSADKPDLLLQALMDGLPAASLKTSLQANVLRDAAAQGLSVPSVKWRGGVEPWSAKPGIWRQRMQIPAEGGYGAMRQWVDALLHEPGLSIDAIDIQRKDLMSDQVKAVVSLSLWWRLAPEGS